MKETLEIEDMRERAKDAMETPKYHGMTYEEGVLAALEWVLGETDGDSVL